MTERCVQQDNTRFNYASANPREFCELQREFRNGELCHLIALCISIMYSASINDGAFPDPVLSLRLCTASVTLATCIYRNDVYKDFVFKKLVYKQPLYGRYEIYKRAEIFLGSVKIYKRAEIFLGSVKFSSTQYSSSLSFLEGEAVSEQSS